MELREMINRRPAWSLLVTALGVALLGMVIAGRLRNRDGELPKFPTQAFYTTDDGATQFADDINKVPPFDHEGKKAVRAWVFTADGGKNQWVQYLQQHSDNDKARLEALQSSADSGAVRGMRPIGYDIYVKRPGAGRWVRLVDPASRAITTPVAPPGMGTDVPNLLSP